MSSGDLGDAFISTKQTLEDAGIQDRFLSNLITSRLLIERVGESDNQAWWDSLVLSETGRTRLSEVTPKTQLKSQINLASEVGQKAESERIPTDSIALFSFGPQMESRYSNAIENIGSNTDIRLSALEELSTDSLTEEWTQSIVTELPSTSSVETTAEFAETPGSSGSFLLSQDGYTQTDLEEQKLSLLKTLLHGYGYCTTQLDVPYYQLESEINFESA